MFYYYNQISIDLYNLFVPFSLTGWIIKPFFSVFRIIFFRQQIHYRIMIIESWKQASIKFFYLGLGCGTRSHARAGVVGSSINQV